MQQMKELEKRIQEHNQKLRAYILEREQVLRKLEELTQPPTCTNSSLAELAKEEFKMRKCQKAFMLLSEAIEFHSKEAYRLSQELAVLILAQQEEA